MVVQISANLHGADFAPDKLVDFQYHGVVTRGSGPFARKGSFTINYSKGQSVLVQVDGAPTPDRRATYSYTKKSSNIGIINEVFQSISPGPMRTTLTFHSPTSGVARAVFVNGVNGASTTDFTITFGNNPSPDFASSEAKQVNTSGSRLTSTVQATDWSASDLLAVEGKAGWLSQPERNCFALFGTKAKLNNKRVVSGGELSSLASVAAMMDEPLKGQIPQILVEIGKMSMTGDEQLELNHLAGSAQARIQGGLFGALINGDNAFDSARGITENVLQTGTVQKGWRINLNWTQRRILARTDLDGLYETVFSELQHRVGEAKINLCPAHLEVQNGELLLTARSGATQISNPIFAVKLKKRDRTAESTRDSAVAGVLGNALGLKSMDAETQALGVALAAAQEKERCVPVTQLHLLPDVAPGSDVVINLGVPGIHADDLESISLRIISKEGATVPQVLHRQN